MEKDRPKRDGRQASDGGKQALGIAPHRPVTDKDSPAREVKGKGEKKQAG